MPYGYAIQCDQCQKFTFTTNPNVTMRWVMPEGWVAITRTFEPVENPIYCSMPCLIAAVRMDGEQA